ncbi:diguanylate cyclase [Vibrio cholerae]
MVLLTSLPMFIASSISLVLSFFFVMLYNRLQSRYEENVHYYRIFSLTALASGLFLGAFAIMLNVSDNLVLLNIFNRVAIVTSMFTIVLGLHFYIAFFDYKAPTPLKLAYAICGLFSLIAVVPSPYFLDNQFYVTSSYYTGLVFGPLFELWGAWILLLAMYCMIVLFRVYLRQRAKRQEDDLRTLRMLLAASAIWMCTGVSDTLTAIEVLDMPPLTWIGSFLLTCCITWILVLHIDELYSERQELSTRLMFDHLTQAYSRSYFEIRLADEVSRSRRASEHRFYLCIFDIDDFKAINDHYGHTSGDGLLKDIARITRDTIRPTDCFARFGGDEFVILLAGLSNDEEAVAIVERIRQRIAQTEFGQDGGRFHASCSFGIVSSVGPQLHSEDLLNDLLTYADEALYQSKFQGKNVTSLAAIPVASTV